MIRKLMLAVIPMVALTGMVRADDTFGLADVASDTSFEFDALTAALTGDELVDDAEVLAVDGSEATEDLDAEAVGCYGYYRSFRRCYSYGYGCYNHYRCYRPVYRCYRPVYRVYNHCYTPIHTYYRHYCW